MSSTVYSVLAIFAVIGLAFVPSRAAESPDELYWKAKLSNIPMPRVLKDSLNLGSKDGISSKLDLVNYGHKSVDGAYVYNRDFTGAQLPQDGRVIYFTDEMLLKKGGSRMKLDFIKTDNEAKFLPKSTPVVSSSNLQVIINHLLVNPKSIAAKDIEKTVKECADNGVKSEVRYCATSLKGMADYANYKLSNSRNNNKLKVLSMEHDIKSLMEYKIQKAQKIGNDGDENQNLVCHKMTNPYAVFLCHNIKNTKMYDVSLLGANGKQLNAFAACHMDTSSWNPKHLAFQLLKIKPGSKPICHFLTGNDLVWLPN